METGGVLSSGLHNALQYLIVLLVSRRTGSKVLWRAFYALSDVVSRLTQSVP